MSRLNPNAGEFVPRYVCAIHARHRERERERKQMRIFPAARFRANSVQMCARNDSLTSSFSLAFSLFFLRICCWFERIASFGPAIAVTPAPSAAASTAPVSALSNAFASTGGGAGNSVSLSTPAAATALSVTPPGNESAASESSSVALAVSRCCVFFRVDMVVGETGLVRERET